MANKPRRILYTQIPKGGGSTLSLYELVKNLDTARYEPIILFLYENQFLKNFNQLGIKTFTLDNSANYINRKRTLIGNIYQFIVTDIPLALRIARLLKKEKIDLLHQNTGFSRTIMMAAFISGIPQVCHFRNFNKKIPLLVKGLMPSVDATLYITQAVADRYTSIGVSVAKSDVVYVPIDTQRFSQPQDRVAIRQQFSIGDNGYLISNVGRITPWKGQHYFVQAMREIVARYPNTKALIVGEPGETHKDKQYFDLLQDMVKQLSLQDHVLFTGNRSDIPEIMSASDIIVHSASKPEPFGRVIAEAMAAGTPVVATRGGGTPEIIEDGVTGFLVPMKSAAGIQEAIQKLLESKDLRDRIRIKAREVVTRRFSVEQHVAKVQKLYAELFHENSTEGP